MKLYCSSASKCRPASTVVVCFLQRNPTGSVNITEEGTLLVRKMVARTSLSEAPLT